MRPIIFILFITGSLLAQQAPYDVYPKAEEPYFRVRYEASSKPGELIFPVKYTVWIPPGVKTLRGLVVHQHGCGVGSCKSGLTGAFDLHWQALAAKHGCALMAPSYEQPEGADCQMWCDPRNGSGAAFRKSLVDLGKVSGHSELATVPWALWGHSGGGHWAGGMVMLHPDKVVAAWLRSGVPLLVANPDRPNLKAHQLSNAVVTVPIMCNFGTKEGYSVKEGRFSGVWPANETFFDTLRSQDAHIGLAIDPLTSHQCGNQRYLAIPWLDVCLSKRLPKDVETELNIISAKRGGFTHKFGERSLWLPDESLLDVWSSYVEDTKVADTTPPPAPTNLTVKGNDLIWNATADLESGLAHFIIERDGVEIATVPDKPTNKFGRPVFQGLQYSDTPAQPLVKMRFTDPKPEAGKTHTYRVISVNTVGLKSP
ncbi:PHB depolymerase family esterase [Akkermansiaceae bacterium]|nr:PHB depolymerase family esterase [Akkermansiaceae bacterium]